MQTCPQRSSDSRAGFTLLETIVYISLLSLIMSSGLVVAWQLIDGMQNMNREITVQEEANFVLEKIDRSLKDAQYILAPSSEDSLTTVLSVQDGDGELTTVHLYDGRVELQRKNNSFVSLTTPNVAIEDLQFYYIAPQGSSLPGVRAVLVMDGETYEVEKYLRY